MSVSVLFMDLGMFVCLHDLCASNQIDKKYKTKRWQNLAKCRLPGNINWLCGHLWFVGKRNAVNVLADWERSIQARTTILDCRCFCLSRDHIVTELSNYDSWFASPGVVTGGVIKTFVTTLTSLHPTGDCSLRSWFTSVVSVSVSRNFEMCSFVS